MLSQAISPSTGPGILVTGSAFLGGRNPLVSLATSNWALVINAPELTLPCALSLNSTILVVSAFSLESTVAPVSVVPAVTSTCPPINCNVSVKVTVLPAPVVPSLLYILVFVSISLEKTNALVAWLYLRSCVSLPSTALRGNPYCPAVPIVNVFRRVFPLTSKSFVAGATLIPTFPPSKLRVSVIVATVVVGTVPEPVYILVAAPAGAPQEAWPAASEVSTWPAPSPPSKNCPI